MHVGARTETEVGVEQERKYRRDDLLREDSFATRMAPLHQRLRISRRHSPSNLEKEAKSPCIYDVDLRAYMSSRKGTSTYTVRSKLK
jgi:hypothetical protein